MYRNDGDLASRTRVPVLTRADGNYFLIGGLELDQAVPSTRTVTMSTPWNFWWRTADAW